MKMIMNNTRVVFKTNNFEPLYNAELLNDKGTYRYSAPIGNAEKGEMFLVKLTSIGGTFETGVDLSLFGRDLNKDVIITDVTNLVPAEVAEGKTYEVVFKETTDNAAIQVYAGRTYYTISLKIEVFKYVG